MTVTSVVPDPESGTLVLRAEYDAPADRVWQLWADPRLLERWWGPPTYPATVFDHDLSVGGRVTYAMTGPEGDSHRGWWRITAVDGPHSLEFDDGFADADGTPVQDELVSRSRVVIEPTGPSSSTMTITTTFPSPEAMQQLLAMGMVEGLTAAVGQTDDVLRGTLTG